MNPTRDARNAKIAAARAQPMPPDSAFAVHPPKNVLCTCGRTYVTRAYFDMARMQPIPMAACPQCGARDGIVSMSAVVI